MELTLQPHRRYRELDAIIIFSDILIVPQVSRGSGGGVTRMFPLHACSWLSASWPAARVCWLHSYCRLCSHSQGMGMEVTMHPGKGPVFTKVSEVSSRRCVCC